MSDLGWICITIAAVAWACSLASRGRYYPPARRPRIKDPPMWTWIEKRTERKPRGED